VKRLFLIISCAVVWQATVDTVSASEPLPFCSEDSVGFACVTLRESIGPWMLERIVPAVGTQSIVMLSTPSFEQLPGLFGREEPAILTLACLGGETQMEFKFGNNFMSDVEDFGRLVYKVDDAPPVALDVVASEDRFALGVASSTVSRAIITRFFGSNRLSVGATSFTGRNMNASFAIDGLRDAVVPLREACDW